MSNSQADPPDLPLSKKIARLRILEFDNENATRSPITGRFSAVALDYGKLTQQKAVNASQMLYWYEPLANQFQPVQFTVERVELKTGERTPIGLTKANLMVQTNDRTVPKEAVLVGILGPDGNLACRMMLNNQEKLVGIEDVPGCATIATPIRPASGGTVVDKLVPDVL